MADKVAKQRQVTNRQIGMKNGQAKLTDDQVKAILSSPAKQCDIAAKFGISPSMVSRIRTRNRWTSISQENVA